MVWELACERGRVWLLRRSEASRDARSKEGGGGLDWGGEGEEEQREGLGRDGWMDGRMDCGPAAGAAAAGAGAGAGALCLPFPSGPDKHPWIHPSMNRHRDSLSLSQPWVPHQQQPASEAPRASLACCWSFRELQAAACRGALRTKYTRGPPQPRTADYPASHRPAGISRTQHVQAPRKRQTRQPLNVLRARL